MEGSLFPVVVVGNKVDLPTKAVTREQAMEWCIANGNCPFFETDAVNRVGVDKLFHKVVEVSKPNDTGVTVLPTSLAGAGGAMQLSIEDDIRRSVLVQQ